MDDPYSDQERALSVLAARGLSKAAQLQQALGKSQPTVSRLLAELSNRVLTVGAGRSTRYGVPKAIMGHAAQQPLWWVDETGVPQALGQLALLQGDVLHVRGDGFETITRSKLPWFLAPLRAQGFLGRLAAQRLSAMGLASNPESWSLTEVLLAALSLPDSPGAICLGEALPAPPLPELPARHIEAALEELALGQRQFGRAGSSAGGEQPKFLARLHTGEQVLVKYSPPRGTPFGERWHDLLHAEHLANGVLARHGVAVAATQVLAGRTRSYLLSQRFDRIGATGRRHVVAVGAVHEAFVPDSYRHWGTTCTALERQGRLSAPAAAQAQALLDFGNLIGNSDMHSGNLSLAVQREHLAKGRFTLAPVYDMLPMRWRPDATLGAAPEYEPFAPSPTALASGAREPAAVFWRELAQWRDVSTALRKVAAQMSVLVQAAA